MGNNMNNMNRNWNDNNRYYDNYNNNNRYMYGSNQYGNNQYGYRMSDGQRGYYGFNKFNSFNVQWQNDYESNHQYACSNGQYMTSYKATKNHPRKKDRMFQIGCGGANAAQNCTWSEWMNNNNNYRETGWQDRRFKAACCMVHNKHPKNCKLSDWVNRWNEFFAWWTPQGTVVTGVYSEYSPADRDRRWKFVYCEL